MRRSLLAAIVGVVLGALLLAGVGTFVVANRGARVDAARQLADDARRVAAETPTILSVRSARLRNDLVRVVRATVGATFVVVAPGAGARPRIVLGTLPPGVPASSLGLARVLAGHVTAATDGQVVHAAVALAGVRPGALSGLGSAGGALRLGRLGTATAPGAGTATAPGAGLVPAPGAGLAGGDTVVMVITRRFVGAGLGGPYLVLVSGIALVLAAVVAVLLSRRIARPLVEAVGATERVAAGDLDVRLAEPPGRTPEMASLTRSINAMAAALARARGQERAFLLSVSHDLRTPLTSILGYAEAIGDGAVDDPAAAAAVITAEARRLGRLVQDLLDLARLDAHQFSLHLQPVPLGPLLAATADGLRPLLASAGLDLQVALPPGDPLRAVVDPDRTAQVMANLLENAYKFAGSTVGLSASTSADGSVVVAVTDDGPGVAPDEAGRLFERLYQSARTPARQGGSGLGLAIVAELVAAMGGAVRVLSPAAPSVPGQVAGAGTADDQAAGAGAADDQAGGAGAAADRPGSGTAPPPFAPASATAAPRTAPAAGAVPPGAVPVVGPGSRFEVRLPGAPPSAPARGIAARAPLAPPS